MIAEYGWGRKSKVARAYKNVKSRHLFTSGIEKQVLMPVLYQGISYGYYTGAEGSGRGPVRAEIFGVLGGSRPYADHNITFLDLLLIMHGFVLRYTIS